MHTDSDCRRGERCEADGQCRNTRCGDGDMACANGERCVQGGRLGQMAIALMSRCAPECSDEADCRQSPGTQCKVVGSDGARACVLAGTEPAGGRCAEHSECMGILSCLDGPGGYCGRTSCDGGCAEGTRCGNWDGSLACLLECINDGDCRSVEGYRCQVEAEGQLGVCALAR